MESTFLPRIKICCISSEQEARLAMRYGADALGLVSSMPSGPGVIDEALIASIAETIPPGVASFLLTSKQDIASIIEQQRRCKVNTLQLCDRLLVGNHEDLRRELPGISIVQVIHITGPEALDEALAIAPYVHALLLDSGNQSLGVKELGGTGKVHDWGISQRIRALVPVPIYLAGGLNASNVMQAMQQVGPFGLDVCSGVRSGGHLDEQKLGSFIKRAHSLSFS